MIAQGKSLSKPKETSRTKQVQPKSQEKTKYNCLFQKIINQGILSSKQEESILFMRNQSLLFVNKNADHKI